MELVRVDAPRLASKNGAMLPPLTDEDRKLVGLELRARRVKRGLHQVAVAKKIKMGIGTVQAIEGNWYAVRDENIERLALFYGTTVEKLLHPDGQKQVNATNPHLKGLNEEHLAIAHGYKDARKRQREAIELVLTHPEEEHFTKILRLLERQSPAFLARLEAVLSATDAEQREQLVELADRLAQFPAVIPILQDLFNPEADVDAGEACDNLRRLMSKKRL